MIPATLENMSALRYKDVYILVLLAFLAYQIATQGMGIVAIACTIFIVGVTGYYLYRRLNNRVTELEPDSGSLLVQASMIVLCLLRLHYDHDVYAGIFLAIFLALSIWGLVLIRHKI